MTHPGDVDLDAQDLRATPGGHDHSIRSRSATATPGAITSTGAGNDASDRPRCGSKPPVRIVTQGARTSPNGRSSARRLEEYLARSRFPDRVAQPPALRAGSSPRRQTSGTLWRSRGRALSSISTTSGRRATPSATRQARRRIEGVAGLLRQRLRQTDVVARIGGGRVRECLLPQTDADQCPERGRRGWSGPGPSSRRARRSVRSASPASIGVTCSTG